MSVTTKKIKYDEDLFKDSTMTFGEHLDELRRCLLMALYGLLLGTLIGLAIGRHVVHFIQRPLERAMERNRLQDSSLAYQEAVKQGGDIGPDSQHADDFVTRERVVYEEVYVEPGQMLNTLRDIAPDTLADAALPQNPPGHSASKEGPTQFLAADIKDAAGLARQLTAGEGTDAAAASRQALALRLSADERKTLQAIADRGNAGADPSQQLLAILNRLLVDPELLPEQQWATLPLHREGHNLRANRTALPEGKRRRLHRLALEALFPQAIAATYPQLAPLRLWRPVEQDPNVKAKTLNAHEGFMIYLKAALVSGAVVSSPWVFYWLWTFVAAGLYPHEKHHVHVFLPFSLGLFFLGAGTAFFFVFDPVLNFLFSYNRWLGLGTDMRISEWMSFVLFLPLGFGISFQLPLVMLFLERIGVFSVAMYTQNWRISVLVICFLAMILTPSDPYSMVLLAAPLTVLYFGGILLCRYMPSGRDAPA